VYTCIHIHIPILHSSVAICNGTFSCELSIEDDGVVRLSIVNRIERTHHFGADKYMCAYVNIYVHENSQYAAGYLFFKVRLVAS